MIQNGHAQFGVFQVVDTIGVQTLLAADLDSDADADVLVITAQGILLYRNLNGLGDLGAAEVLLAIVPPDHVHVACADLDGDRDNDLLFGRASDSTLYWMPNTDGLGNFGTPLLVAALPAPMMSPGREVCVLRTSPAMDFLMRSRHVADHPTFSGVRTSAGPLGQCKPSHPLLAAPWGIWTWPTLTATGRWTSWSMIRRENS
ncbi:MAG: VCBS repeat-containing protein [Flavobacteriales bacterium]|nr:VCBS repeat-containing protein [Flavobacteriales bacterium]